MGGHSRIRRVAKWAGLMLSIAMLCIWLLTAPVFTTQCRSFGYRGNTTLWWVGHGGVVWGHVVSPQPCGFFATDGFAREWPWRWRLGLYGPHVQATGFVTLPWWLPFLIVAVPTMLLWHFDRRRRIPAGHCRKCAYDLRGNESGVCPECGTAILVRVQMRESG